MSDIGNTKIFFDQCLKAIVHKNHIDNIDLDLSYLQYLLSTHRLYLVFIDLLQTQTNNTSLIDLLSKNALSIIRRYLMLSAALVQLISSLKAAKIEAIVLKGIPLNQQLYAQKCLRESNDIDILISSDKILTAHQHLLQLGYIAKSFISPVKLVSKYTFLLHYIHEILYWHPVKKIHIDLHWQTNIMNRANINWIDYTQITNIKICSQNIHILNLDQNFFYLCTHAAQHHWDRLQWLIDIVMLYQKYPICLANVYALAKKTKTTRSLLEACILLRKQFDINIDCIPHSKIDAIIVRTRVRWIQANWFAVKKQRKLLLSISNVFMFPSIAQKLHHIMCFVSVHDKKSCHARAGGQPSIKIIRYSNQATGDCFAR